MSQTTTAPRLVHVFSTFRPAGPQLRIAATINYLGPEFDHIIVSMDGNVEAAYRLNGHAAVEFAPPPGQAGSLLRALDFRRWITERQPSLVITYNWGAIDAVAGALLARVCPVLHNEHGFGPDEAERLNWRRVLARRVLLRGAFRTLVPSLNLQHIALEQYRLPASKVQYIASGVDLQRFQAVPRTAGGLRQAWGAANETLVFGYVGLLRPEKNLQHMLRAFAAANLPDSLLVLVGNGPEHEPLMRLSGELGIQTRVRFSGTTQDTPAYYAAFDVFLMSSLTEQMPMAMIEAMACGLPVVCTDVGDSAEMAGTGEPPQIVPVRDLDAYAAALCLLAQDSLLRRKLGEANAARCRVRYGFQRMAEEYGAVYREALAQAR